MPRKSIASLETEALTLPAPIRAVLAKHLIASLDNLNEQETEQMWLDEAEHRYQAYKLGTLSGREAFEAIADIRTRL